MENQSNSKQDCGCSDGCCTPSKKGKLWTKLVFVAIIVTAGAIITVKLVGKNEKPPAGTNCTVNVINADSADTTNIKSCAKACDTTKSSSCCPRSEK
ncbi:MAG: hypothetical protein KJ607_08025 [Bacteroidetes bacterium]|nr:hypothetical protein [Bacteroidota bacterium]